MTTLKQIRRNRTGRRARQRGMSLVFAVFTIAALLVAITGALVTSSANNKAAWNYKAASQAHFVAESGISHALQTINAIGCVNYNNEIVNTWGTMYGTTAKTFNSTAVPGYRYTVTNAAGATPASTGRLVATATQLDVNNNVMATNTVVANIVRDNNPSTAPGAIYLATDSPTNSVFIGQSFTVDGNDHTLSGGPGTGISIPGISTRNATNTSETVTSLNGGQIDNVLGYGFEAGPPVVPSVSTSPSAPTIAQINQMVADMSVTNCPCQHVNNSCTCNFGNPYTTPNPTCTVTQFGNGTTSEIKNNGNVDGCGVMIVDGNLDIQGDVLFRGLIIVKGALTVTGSALIYGSVWAQGVNLNVGGNGQVYFSSQAMQLANNVFPTGTINAPMKIATMADCAELGSGLGGCP